MTSAPRGVVLPPQEGHRGCCDSALAPRDKRALSHRCCCCCSFGRKRTSISSTISLDSSCWNTFGVSASFPQVQNRSDSDPGILSHFHLPILLEDENTSLWSLQIEPRTSPCCCRPLPKPVHLNSHFLKPSSGVVL